MASLWDLVEKKEEPQEQQKEETKKIVKEVKEEDKVEEKKKTTAKKADAKKTTAKKEKQVETFEYPFSLFLGTANNHIDITNYGFEDGKRYTGKEISKIMLQHRDYGFAGDMEYTMMKDDNTLVVNAKQYKKG